MYGKLFSSMYDGTLVTDWRALITFQQMIILCDADGVIDVTPDALSRRTGIPIDHIKAGIDVLEKPDSQSRTPKENGVRIKRLDDHRDWGWIIVNHEIYKNLQDSDTKRTKTRERQRRYRERHYPNDVTQCNDDVTDCNVMSHHTDTNTNKKRYTSKVASQAFEEFWALYPRKVGKKPAMAKWNSMNLDEQASAIMAALRDQIDQWEDVRFVPHPTTYLNNERWNDELSTVETPTWK